MYEMRGYYKLYNLYYSFLSLYIYQNKLYRKQVKYTTVHDSDDGISL